MPRHTMLALAMAIALPALAVSTDSNAQYSPQAPVYAASTTPYPGTITLEVDATNLSQRVFAVKQRIRIVPAHIVIPSSGCVLWEYEKSLPVAFGETDLAKVFVQDPAAIARTRLLFEHLDAVALDAGQSRSRLAEYVSPPREEFDGRGPRLA